ncbi:DUF6266 family protein [Sphingobacterium sp. E70]|uniref:DUF6266 family protein n=1 Tax=Sphingobacterium sp. E70 TaxID=2853439 RepID=UPI00211C2A5E|nr:DUF6266 family protein [Sphingobacterium sp. E70]
MIWTEKADRQTPVNAAFQFNLPLVIQGAYPNFQLDYSKVRISDGIFYLAPTQPPTYANEELS